MDKQQRQAAIELNQIRLANAREDLREARTEYEVIIIKRRIVQYEREIAEAEAETQP